MAMKLETEGVMEKVKALCADMLRQENFQEMRGLIDRFAKDDGAVKQYEQFVELHETIQEKEQALGELSPEDVRHYEQEELALYENEVIRGFLFAQREFGNLLQRVNQLFTKTIELNRLPEADELSKGGCGCGGSCGCGGHH